MSTLYCRIIDVALVLKPNCYDKIQSNIDEG